MRREFEEEVEASARSRFRMMVLLYLAYPAVILSLLGVIGVGAYYVYMTKYGPIGPVATGPEPVWCGPQAGTMPAYLPSAQSQDGFESAVPSAGIMATTFGSALGGMPTVGPGLQGAVTMGMDPVKYYASQSIKAADGAPDARYRRDSIGLSQNDMNLARKEFVERSRQDGKLGFYRLGIAQLGAEAYDIAGEAGLTVPFCRPNDFATQDKSQAYVSFAVASMCDTAQATRAHDWLAAIAEHENYSPDQKAAFDSEARSYFAAGSQVCTPQLLAADDGSAQGGAPPDSEMGPDDNSEVTGAPPPEAQAALAQQTKEQLIANYARQLLSLGDAALAQGRNRRARRYWSQAIEVGKAVGAQAAIVAQKRIQTHTLTCHFTDESLKAISRDYKRLSGDLIHMRVIQQALHALGHYDGPNNGVLGIMTRAAIRKFQREMAFDETDTLNPLQTVYLICNAAETTRDLASQNALGIMYAAGLGVEQNIDLALEWLRAASSRGYADSTFNLALLYGSGIVLNSYRLCDIPQSPEQADQYLQEAANQGQPRATYLLQRYGPRSSAKDVRERWKLIETEQLAQNDKDGIYAKRLATIGAKCDPDRATR